MNAIILAAGMGRRIQPMGWEAPKCLLPCPGGTLLDNALSALTSRGIDRVAIVVGYKKDQVQEVARKHGRNVGFVVNGEYAATNTLHSLHLAREFLHAGAILVNGDVWFRDEALDALDNGDTQNVSGEILAAGPAGARIPSRTYARKDRAVRLDHGGGTSALLVVKHTCSEEEVKVATGGASRITGIGKELNPATAAGEYVGIACLTASAGCALARNLETCVGAGHSRQFYEYSLNQILPHHVIQAAFIRPSDAFEIDTSADYAAAQDIWERSPKS